MYAFHLLQYSLGLIIVQDYVDACERLSQLNLTEFQQREIIRVLLHCCGNVRAFINDQWERCLIPKQEKSYNPYYTLIGQHLCRSAHSYKITIQFCLWDFLRDLGESAVGGAEVIKNIKGDEDEGFNVTNMSKTRLWSVARTYAWWIAKDCVTLTILKVSRDISVFRPSDPMCSPSISRYSKNRHASSCGRCCCRFSLAVRLRRP